MPQLRGNEPILGLNNAHPHLLTKPYVIYNMKTQLTLNLRTIPKISRACMCQR
jgi:hypothetical protein